MAPSRAAQRSWVVSVIHVSERGLALDGERRLVAGRTNTYHIVDLVDQRTEGGAHVVKRTSMREPNDPRQVGEDQCRSIALVDAIRGRAGRGRRRKRRVAVAACLGVMMRLVVLRCLMVGFR